MKNVHVKVYILYNSNYVTVNKGGLKVGVGTSGESGGGKMETIAFERQLKREKY